MYTPAGMRFYRNRPLTAKKQEHAWTLHALRRRTGTPHRQAIVAPRVATARLIGAGLHGYGYGYILGPRPVPPICLSGSFGLVRPARI